MIHKVCVVSCALGVASAASGNIIDDPMGDTFGFDVPQHDLTRASAFYTADSLILSLHFADAIAPGSAGLADSVVGVIELDVDLDPATGATPLQNDFDGPASIDGVGVDFTVELFDEMDGVVPVLSTETDEMFFASIVFGVNWLEVRISLDDLGDDGIVAVTSIIGTIPEPTDALERSFESSFIPAPGALSVLMLGGLLVRRRRG